MGGCSANKEGAPLLEEVSKALRFTTDWPGAALVIGTEELFATVKGTTSSRWKGTMSRMPVSTPSCDEIPLCDGR